MESQEKNMSFEDTCEELLLTYVRGDTSNDETLQVERWLQADEANEQILLQIASIFYARQRQRRIEKRNPMQAFEKARRHIERRTRQLWIRRISVAAACIAGVIVLSNAISHWREEPVVTPSTQMVTIQANAGTRSRFDLPDGTVVHLNSGSKLSYPIPFDREQRRVTLEGEAYFEVSHHPEWPFVAGIPDDRLRVKVLGTEFNLHAFSDDPNITVTLVSGKVDVEAKGLDNKIYAGTLLPSEMVIYDTHTGKISIEKVNTASETGWIGGKLVFSNSLLSDVLKKLSHFYNVRFDVKNEAINQYRFTGTLDNKQLFQALEYLRISSNIKSQIKQENEETIVIIQ